MKSPLHPQSRKFGARSTSGTRRAGRTSGTLRALRSLDVEDKEPAGVGAVVEITVVQIDVAVAKGSDTVGGRAVSREEVHGVADPLVSTGVSQRRGVADKEGARRHARNPVGE